MHYAPLLRPVPAEIEAHFDAFRCMHSYRTTDRIGIGRLNISSGLKNLLQFGPKWGRTRFKEVRTARYTGTAA